MASYIYPQEPGSKYGPCEGKCPHIDCELMREDSARKCRICGEPIGYDNLVYFEPQDLDNPNTWGNKTVPVHVNCVEFGLDDHELDELLEDQS